MKILYSWWCFTTALLLVAPRSLHGQLIAAKDTWVDHGDYVDVSNPPCKNLPENALQTVTDGLVQGKIKIPSLDKFVGTIIDLTSPQLSDAIAQTGGDIGRWYVPNRYANCFAGAIELPSGSSNISFRASAGGNPCSQRDGPYFICQVGWSAWGVWQEGNFATIVFKNWSHNLARTARIEVYGVVPPPPLAWPKRYLVVKGDCLAKIAQKTYGNQNWPKIYRKNREIIRDPDLIYPGQALELPSP